MKIAIDSKFFELNVELARAAGALKPIRPPIVHFEIGDVFMTKDENKIVILDHGYRTGLYVMGGCCNKPLELYSNTEKTREEMVVWLNHREAVYVKNINQW